MRVMRLMVRAGTCWIIGVAMMCVRAGVEAGLSAKAPQRRRTESCAAYISWWLGWLHGLEALRRVSGFSGGRRSSEGREGMRRMRRRVCLGGMGCRVGEGNSPCQRRRWRPPVSYSFRIGIKDAAIRPSAPSHIAPPRDSVFGQLVVNSMSALDRCKLHAGMRCLHPESRSRQGGVIGGGECVCRRGLMGDRSVGESPEPDPGAGEDVGTTKVTRCYIRSLVVLVKQGSKACGGAWGCMWWLVPVPSLGLQTRLAQHAGCNRVTEQWGDVDGMVKCGAGGHAASKLESSCITTLYIHCQYRAPPNRRRARRG
jgi:hypothetical protein